MKRVRIALLLALTGLSACDCRTTVPPDERPSSHRDPHRHD